MLEAGVAGTGERPRWSSGHWHSLPNNRLDKAFWAALNEYLAPSMHRDFPLASKEFHNSSINSHSTPDEDSLLSDSAMEAANNLRSYYDDISLWNPLSLAFHLGTDVSAVIEQLVLGKECGLLSMFFVVPCRSCGCDIFRVSAVREICFHATYHETNIIRCPICTDCTEVTDLTSVGVFFQKRPQPGLLRRKYHRLFYSDEAKQRWLESYFFPPGASFAFRMRLPEGRYLFIASGIGAIIELHVRVGAEFLEANRPFHVVTISMDKTLIDDKNEKPRRVINAQHGKITFCAFNGTPYGGYLDVFVAFDDRLEFLSQKPPILTSVPMVLHHAARGLRSPLINCFVPRPPGSRTSGVYVLHSFVLPGEVFEPSSAGTESVLAVIREVHRYSLEDHHGLLISVSQGGSMFESSFLTATAALASTLCLAQRVVTRLGEDVAATLTCSITQGEMFMASFQEQYDDDENVRSAYPDISIIGSVVHAATHPPVVLANSNDEKESSSEPVEQCVRVELRSASENQTGVRLEPSTADAMFPFFLSYLGDHFASLRVLNEPQALIVVVPLSTLNAAVMLPSMLDPLMYEEQLTGPFG